MCGPSHSSFTRHSPGHLLLILTNWVKSSLISKLATRLLGGPATRGGLVVWRAVRLALLLTGICVPAVLCAPDRTTPGIGRAETPARELRPGAIITEEISAGDLHRYKSGLRAGDYLRATLTKADLNVSVLILDPEGRSAGEFASERYGPLPLSLVAEREGDYTFEVRSLEKSAARVRYELRVEALRGATAEDRRDDRAARDYADAERLRAEWGEKSFREAVRKYAQAAAHWQATGRLREAAAAMRDTGEVYFTLSEYAPALEAYRRALAFSRAANDWRGEMQALNHTGYVYVYVGESNKARPYFRRMLNYYLRTRSPHRNIAERRGEAQTLNNMGEALYSLGELKKALEHFAPALALWEEAGDRAGQALAHLNIGYAHSDSGDLQRALEHFEAALSLWREVGHRRGEALSQTAVGTVHSFVGEKQKALDSHKQAMAILQAVGDRLGEAVTLNSTGRAYEDLNEPRTALDCYQRALEIYRKNGNLDFEAVTLYYLGRVYDSLGDTERALHHHRQSISLSRAAGQRRVEAYALTAVSKIHTAQGRRRQALGQLRRALALYRGVGDRRGQANMLNSIGYLHYAAGSKRKALRFYEAALPLSRAARDRNGEADTLYDISRAASDTGDTAKALARIEESIKLIESLRAMIPNRALRASYFASVQKHYGFYIDFLMRMHERHPSGGFAGAALRASEKARARSLLEVLNEADINIKEGVDPALLARERGLQQSLSAKAAYQMRLLNSNRRDEREGKEVEREINRLMVEHEHVQAQLRERSPRYATLMQPSLPGIEEIQAELRGGNTLLLEYALGDERSYLWAVTPDSVTSYRLPPRSQIEEAARKVYSLLTARQELVESPGADYDARVSASEREYWREAAALGEMLLGPVAAQLGTKRLLVVADGALQYIPFDALPAPAAPGGNSPANGAAGDAGGLVPVALRHEVVSLPSASTLVLMQRDGARAEPADRLVAVLADPVFERDDPRVGSPAADGVEAAARGADGAAWLRAVAHSRGPDGGAGIPRLPATRQEAEMILAFASRRDGIMATGFDASRETATSAEVGRYRVVHFATHGFVNSEHPELSGILLTMVNRQGAHENGFLHMHDIYNLKLSAQLVVLSACSTGLGRDIKGEGLIGLTRGFMYAGSKSVIASLWKVDDRATAELMKHFYRAMLEEGLPPAAALRAAKEAMWRQRRWSSPYFWAAFVLQGEYRDRIGDVPPPPAARAKTKLLLALALLAAASLAHFALFRRRLKFKRESA
jgi:CHAT domain-containing protein/tetratricopeptide (TPR) repeat protein